MSGWRSAVTWRRLGDLVGHPSSVCSRRPPVLSSKHGVTAANIYQLAGGARRLYYILWAARGPQLTSSPCARSAGRLNGGTRASWTQKMRVHAARAAVAAAEACSADAEAPRRAAPAPAEPMRQRVEKAGAHRRGDAGGPMSRCRKGGAGVMAKGAKTAVARADGGLRQSGRRRWLWRWPKAVVPRGGAAAWWGRVGSTESGLGCGWLRTRWRPVARGRDVVIKAIAAFVGAPPAPPAPAPLFLQPGQA